MNEKEKEEKEKLPTVEEILRGETRIEEVVKNRLPTPNEILKGLNGSYERKPTVEDKVKIHDLQIKGLTKEILNLKKRKVKRVKSKIVKVKKKIKKKEIITKVKKPGKEIVEEEKKRGRKKKIIEIPKELIQKGKFRSKDIQDFFNTTPMTASRYIKQWILEGKIKRIGSKKSPKVFYQLVDSKRKETKT